MEALCSEFSISHPEVSTKIIAVDLISEPMVDTIAEEIAGLDIGLLVNNAGVECNGAFLNIDDADRDNFITLNTTAFTAITRLFGKLFVARNRTDQRKRSGMIIISSMATGCFPYMAVYGASNAYVSSLGMALRAEWESDRVDIAVIEPGLIDTDMAARGEDLMVLTKAGFEAMNPKLFIKYAMNAFFAGKHRFTPGAKNRIVMFSMGLMPQDNANTVLGSMIWKAGSPQLLKYKTEA